MPMDFLNFKIIIQFRENYQMKNIDKFEGEDFMFQLKTLEVEELLRCKTFTLNRGARIGNNINYIKPLWTMSVVDFI